MHALKLQPFSGHLRKSPDVSSFFFSSTAFTSSFSCDSRSRSSRSGKTKSSSEKSISTLFAIIFIACITSLSFLFLDQRSTSIGLTPALYIMEAFTWHKILILFTGRMSSDISGMNFDWIIGSTKHKTYFYRMPDLDALVPFRHLRKCISTLTV